MDFTDAELLDLTKLTTKTLGRLKFQQIAQDLTEYYAIDKLLKGSQVSVENSGLGVQRNLMLKYVKTARHVGMYQKDVLNVADLMEQMSITWRHITDNWSMDRVENLMNADDAETLILKVIEPRRMNVLLSIASTLEQDFFTLADPTSKIQPWGLLYWIVKNSSTGFYGGAPSGYTTVGGINPTTYPNWKNYTGTYSTVSKTDLIQKMRTMFRKINWKSPKDIQDYRTGKGDKMNILVNEATLSEIELEAEKQNDNLGNDIASMDNNVVFKKLPFVYIPYLDADTTNPLYFVDYSTFFTHVLKGNFLRESEPIKGGIEYHNLIVTFTDLTFNWSCVDRRRNGVLYKA